MEELTEIHNIIGSVHIVYRLQQRRSKTEQDPPTDTATEEDTGGVVDCNATLSSTPSIELPTSSWFFRDAVELTFDEVNIALALTLTDGDGRYPVGFEWNESREIAYVMPESGTWIGDEEYTW